MNKLHCIGKGKLFTLLLFTSLNFFAHSIYAQTLGDYRSNNAAFNWSTNTGNVWQRWNGTSWVNNPAEGYPGQNVTGLAGTVTIQNGHTVTLDVSPAQNIGNLVIGAGTSGTLIIGNSAASQTLTATGDVTVNAGATFRSANNGAPAHVINIGGNLTNNGTFNLNFSTDIATVAFTGANRIISGSGTFTFRNLTRSTSNTNLQINNSILVNGVIDINTTTNCLIVVSPTANLTLGAAATITASAGNPIGTNKYILLDGTTGSGSQLIRTNNGTTAAWQFLFPIGTSSGGYTPLNLTGATITTAPTNNSTLAVKAIYNSSVTGHLRRTFRMIVSGNAAATSFTGGTFAFNATSDLSSGDASVNLYTTVWFLDTSSGSWSNIGSITPPVTSPFAGPTSSQMLNSGTYFYTIGAASSYQTWYSYQTGNWNVANNWTQDPTGSTLVNPQVSFPDAGDVVVILNGLTITNNVANQDLYSVTIQGGGVLDLAATTGHNLGAISGAGVLRMNGTNLPAGTYTSFVAAGTGGTIEYYNTSGTLSTTQTTYNKLLFSNTTGSAVTFITASNLTVNNNLNVTQVSGGGSVTWQINNASNVQRTMSIAGDLIVSANAGITVGTGAVASSPHSLSISGSITNSGTIKFFNPSNAGLSVANYTSGAVYTDTNVYGDAVNVTLVGITDVNVTCSGTTDFYRLIIDKGTGQQAMVTLNSSNTANFRLFGSAVQNQSGSAPNFYSNNALSIIDGTLQLTGNITIPSLIENSVTATDGWPIPQNGALWVNGAGVSVTVTSTANVNDGRRLLLYGLLRVSSGTVLLGYSRGLCGGDAGFLVVEGGTVTCSQFRPRSSSPNFSYVQSGGIVNVGTINGVADNNSAQFSLPTATSTFKMSGGTLNIAIPNNTGVQPTAMEILSSSSYSQVTGGTVNITINKNQTFGIASNAPFFNLTIDRSFAGSTVPPSVQVQTYPLVVLNNLTLVDGANDPALDCNALGLTVGGNLDVQTGTTLNLSSNTLTFNGSGAQTWTFNGTISNFNNVVMNKTAGTLTLGGSGTFNIPNLTLTSGTLFDNGKAVTATASLTNNATHTSSGTGAIAVNGPTTISGNNGTFGNLTLLANATVGTNGILTVTNALRLASGTTAILNIGANALTVSGPIYSDPVTTATAFSANKMITTNGLHNAGGLTQPCVANVPLLFPIGTGALYTPNTITVPTATTFGTITSRAVNSEHPNVTTTNQSVLYYWRVTSSGFVGLGATVTHSNYNFSTAVKNGTTTTYQAARYDRATNTWGTQNTAQSMTTSILPSPFNTGTTWTGVTGDKLDGEYTCGNIAAFGTVRVFYSRTGVGTPGLWNINTTWSNASIGGAAVAVGSTPGVNFPGPNNPVIVGDATNAHGVVIDANSRSCGTLNIGPTSVLDCSTFTSLNFGTNTGGAVIGTGTLRIAAVGAGVANMFPAGDFTNFIGPNGGTIEWYGNTKTIPLTGQAPQSLTLNRYYNLVLNPTAGQTITLPATGLTIYNDLTQTGGGTVTNDDVARTHTITRNLTVSAGTFTLANTTPATSVTLSVGGTTTVGTGALFGVTTGGTATNTLTTPGGITNNGTLRFLSGSAINIVFTGTSDVNFTGTGSVAAAPNGTTLSGVTINKGSNSTPTVTFDLGGTITTATSGWLTLINGTFNFNTGATHSIATTASGTFTIPPTTKLKVQSGTVSVVTGTNSAADLFLNGTLEITGGTVNVGAAANTIDNDIEYSSAGSPTILVSSVGALNVNGSIRRSTSALSGALIYNQSGTSVVTARGKASATTRGVFEIDNNTGSSFNMSGTSLLSIERTTGGASYGDLYLNPVNASVAAGSTIQMGLNTGTTQSFRFNSSTSVGNFNVVGGGAGPQTVTMYSNDMIALGSLSVCATCTLNTNSLNVSVGGNFSTNTTGVYNGAANTTTFNGSGAQAAALSSVSQFLNMTVNKSAGTVTLSGTAPTLNNLNILNGTLNVDALNLQVNGDIVINSSQIATPGTGAIVMSGTSTVQNITSSGGSFTHLTLGGAAAAKNVKVSGDLTINGTLLFQANRYLTIGSSQLTFGTGGTTSTAGSTAFIRTNGVTSDLGVVKSWGASGSTQSFAYAIGTTTNYTPVTIVFNNVTTGGNLTVVPVNQRHPTANVTGERILSYYWIVTRDNSLAYTASGSQTYVCPVSLLTGAGGTLAAGILDVATAPGWVTSGHGGTPTTPPPTMAFANLLSTNLPGAGNTFHYTLGTSTVTTATLPNPIVPVYSRFANADFSSPTTVNTTGGNWNSASSWTTNSSGYGNALASPPTGIPVVILNGATIIMDVSARAAFKTQINGTGVLTLNNTFGHNLGIISGTGTMRTATNTFPAGNYTAFVSAAGGTIEYVAPMTMNNRTSYNNLSIFSTSSGTVTMTNSDLTINGNVTIPSGTTLDNSVNNRNMTVARNWTNNGTFSAGTGTVTFNGTGAQNTTGTTTFNNLIINKSNNLTLGNTTTVNGALTLTAGNIISNTYPTAPLLILGASSTLSGGSVSSFVSGQMRKIMNSGTTFTYPLGSNSASRYRPIVISATSATDTWNVSYIPNNPTSDLFPNLTFNNANMAKVSQYEYWQVANTSGTTSAGLTLSFGAGSYGGSDIGDLSSMKTARWDGTQWDLPPGGGSFIQSGSNIAGTVSVSVQTAFSPQTLATDDINSTLPITLVSFTGQRLESGVLLKWKTAQEINNDHFEVERSSDGLKFTKIATLRGAGTSSTAKEYLITDKEFVEGTLYYRLKQVDFDSNFTYSSVVKVDPIEGLRSLWVAYPNPVEYEKSFQLGKSNSSVDEMLSIDVVVQSIEGRIIFKESGSVKEVNKQLLRDIPSLAAGIYILQVYDGASRDLVRIVKH